MRFAVYNAGIAALMLGYTSEPALATSLLAQHDVSAMHDWQPLLEDSYAQLGDDTEDEDSDTHVSKRTALYNATAGVVDYMAKTERRWEAMYRYDPKTKAGHPYCVEFS